MAFALAAFINPSNFPIATPAAKRAVTPASTLTRFMSAYPNDSLTIALNSVVASQDFIDWSATRNILAHRVSPPRMMFVGGPQHGTANWMGLGTLGPAVTRDRRIWLSAQLTELVHAAADFADARL